MFNYVYEVYSDAGFTIEGNQILGNVEGYNVSATHKRSLNLDIYYYATPEQKELIKEQISSIKRMGLKLHFTATGLNYTYIPWKTNTTANTSFGALGALCTMKSSLKESANTEIELLCEIIKILKNNNVKGNGFCPYCGEELTEEDSVCLPNNGHQICVHRHCVDSINAILEKEYNEFNNISYPKVFAAGLLGVIVSCILYYLLSSIFIAPLSFVVGTFTTFGLLKLFKVNITRKVLAIIYTMIGIFALLVTVSGPYLSYLYLHSEDLTMGFFEYYKSWFFEDFDIFAAYVICMLFTMLGIGLTSMIFLPTIKHKSLR